MATIVVEDDKILRFLQVILDPDVSDARVAAFRDYLSFDVPDPDGWFAEMRQRAAAIYPSTVRMVEDEAAMRAALPGADALVTEGLTVGAEDLAAAPNLKFVQKFGLDGRNVDAEACAAARVELRTLRRRVNGTVAEHAILLMLAVGRKLCETNGALDFAALEALGYKPKKFDPDHVAGANWARVTGLRSLQGATLGALGLARSAVRSRCAPGRWEWRFFIINGGSCPKRWSATTWRDTSLTKSYSSARISSASTCRSMTRPATWSAGTRSRA